MNRQNAVLAILASANGLTLTPVQLQKAAFLLQKSGLLDEATFDFVPYDYGPFDKAVYDEAGTLACAGLATISPSPYGRWNVYAASSAGVDEGKNVVAQLPAEHQKYLTDLVAWVRAQSFSSLVKTVYDKYPEMKANSIFQG